MAYTTVNKSTDYFNTKLYTGNGSTNAITGVGFQPDWLWLKDRSAGGGHILVDAVRGNNKSLSSQDANAEVTRTDIVTAFNSDGFTLGADSGNFVNVSGNNGVGWNWKANGAGSANTDGSINTTATSANTTSGFSISTYTGTGSNATIGHGLGAVPNIVLVKSTSGDDQHWCMYNSNLGNTSRVLLNLTNAVQTGRSEWQSTTPTSSVFSLDGSNQVNGSGRTYVAYCFAEKQGFSKFGSYVGNGNADGAFVYTGFKPAFVIIKRTDATANWVMTDNKISFNGKGSNNSTVLFPSTSAAESDAYGLMLHSNGFKFSGSDSASATVNGSGATYIFMAFAAAPLVGSNNVPATAR